MDRSGQIPLTIDKYDPELYTRVCKLGNVTTNNDELRAEYQKGNIKRADREKLMTHFVDSSTQAVITAKIEKLDVANGQLNEINNDLRSSNHQIRNYHKSMAGVDESLKVLGSDNVRLEATNTLIQKNLQELDADLKPHHGKKLPRKDR